MVQRTLDHVVVLQAPRIARAVAGVVADVAGLVACRGRSDLQGLRRGDVVGAGDELRMLQQDLAGRLREKSPAREGETQDQYG